VQNAQARIWSLRHSAITNAIRHNATPLQVQRMARHSDIKTTLGYYHESDRLEDPPEDRIDYSEGEGEQ
jgi:integrase